MGDWRITRNQFHVCSTEASDLQRCLIRKRNMIGSSQNVLQSGKSVTSLYHMAAKFLDRIWTIFLDGDNHFPFLFWTMEEKHELPFCSWMQSCTWRTLVNFFVFTAIFAGPRTVCWDPEICYHHGSKIYSLLYKI